MNNENRKRGVDGVEMETKYVRERRKPTPNAFEDAGLSTPTVEPIQSINITAMPYNITNATLLGNGTSTDENTYNASDTILTVLCPIFLITFCIFGQRANVPSSQYHRGELFRRQAERVWAIQQAKAEREAIPTETRKEQIKESLRKMRVVSKCSQTGHCVLGEIEEEEDSKETEDEDNSVQSTNTGEEKEPTSDDSSTATEDPPLPPQPPTPTPTPVSKPSVPKSSISKCPESPGRTERRPLLSPDSEDSEDNFGSTEEPSELSQTNNCAPSQHHSSIYDFEDDEDVCPICLDNFELGDIVMFARHNQGSCAHVFHEECLLQWLLEQRENECPTCRNKFIQDADTNSTSSSSSTTDTNENSLIDTNENSIIEVGETEDSFADEEAMRNESEGDIEEGNGTDDISHNANVDNNDGTNCTFDLDEMADKNVQADGEDRTDDSKTDDADDMEQGYTYIIVKGSVQRVPPS